MKVILSLFLSVSLTACATYQPKQLDDVCQIFRGETDWYLAAKDSNQRWGTPIGTMMSIIRQESSFVDDAQPPRDWFLFVPLPRKSTAYGYAQAQDGTWDDYIKATGNSGADRDEFDDAIDFVGWYTDSSNRILGISKWSSYEQYLAYHEGWGGYKRGSYNQKAWLQKVAKKVAGRASNYNSQLKQCRDELDAKSGGWF